MTQKPAGIPEDAVWSPDDQEWVIEPLDDEGRKHGECLYWRSNGSLVNRCQYEAGEPHGQYYRYHDHGEISRQGTFRHGQLHGVDVFFRTDSPTQENFPDGLSEIVWRAELDMSNGRAVGGRCFDREGRQVTERGEPVPDRPASVPDGAIYFARQEQWRSGQTDQSFRFDGTWNIYSSEGDLIAQQGFSSGTKVWENVFDEPLEGKIVSAIDAGRTLEAINAATELSNSESEQSRCIGTKYLISLSPKKGLQVARSIFENPPKTNTWWIFTRAASKALDAFAEVMNSLAWRQFEEMELEEALATIELAIKLHPNPPNTVLVTKTRLLLASRMDDEAFTLAKRVLALLPDDEARELISDLDEERRFSEWLKALDTETMTTEGAWSILGERGERLFEFARYAETQEQPDPVEMGYYDSSWPIDEALEERLSDELSILTSSRQTQDDHVTCFSFLYPLLDSTVIGGIRVRDGIWIARFQSIFLPLSLVYQVGETGFFATWNPSTHGSSQVYLTHADSRGFDRVYASVAGFLADHLTEVFDELELSAQLTEKWEKATELTLEEEIELPSHLDIDQLEPRTLWLST